jgi:hypothetical protein
VIPTARYFTLIKGLVPTSGARKGTNPLINSGGGRRGRVTVTAVAAVAAVALAGIAGCDGSSDEAGAGSAAAPTSTGSATGGSATGGCAAPLSRPLPTWARAGFSGDASAIHVMGERGDIVAVLFGHPLRQPPAPGRNNKILWVSRVAQEPGEPLAIEAHLDGTGPAVRREVLGGPGPSIIDLPSPGCWRLDLAWSGHRDAVWLTYQR